VFLCGNLTRDPEIRYTSSGMAVGDLRLAVSSKFREREENLFINVTVWDRQAETCGEYLSKGSPILCEGRLKLEEWERDGQKHSRISVVASRVQFLGSPRNAEFRDSPDDRPPRPSGAPAPAPASAPAPAPEPAAPPEPEPPHESHFDVSDTQDDDNLPF
jgi:single-strand DNA-binding protein